MCITYDVHPCTHACTGRYVDVIYMLKDTLPPVGAVSKAAADGASLLQVTRCLANLLVLGGCREQLLGCGGLRAPAWRLFGWYYGWWERGSRDKRFLPRDRRSRRCLARPRSSRCRRQMRHRPTRAAGAR